MSTLLLVRMRCHTENVFHLMSAYPGMKVRNGGRIAIFEPS
jgi:hypothetical protein